VDGKTLAELANSRMHAACSCERSPAERPRPIFQFWLTLQLQRGDVVTIVGTHSRRSGHDQRCWAIRTAPTDVADVAFYWCGNRRSAHCLARSSTSRERASHSVHLRRRIDRRPLLGVAALGAPDIRSDSVTHCLVHEFSRSERFSSPWSASRPGRGFVAGLQPAARPVSSIFTRSRVAPPRCATSFNRLKANRLLHPGDTIALGNSHFHALSRNDRIWRTTTSRSYTSKRRKKTGSSLRTTRSRNSKIRRSRRSSSSIPAIRPAWL